MFYSVAIHSQVVINEFMAANTAGITDEAGDHDDWLELYNASDEAVDLSGWYLSDDLADTLKWQFPVNTEIAAQGYLLLWLDDEPEEGELHVTMKLNRDGESIILTQADSATVVDSHTYGQQLVNKSTGRITDGATGFTIFSTPTPNASNVAGMQQAAAPVFSYRGGLYSEAVTIQMGSPTSGAQIHYTTDGTIPTENSNLYTTPLQFATSTALRARAFIDNETASEVNTATYLINIEHVFPIVSIVGDPADFNNVETGIFVNTFLDSNIVVNAELYEPDGTTGFNQLVEAEVQGTSSIELDQKSLALKAKGSLGNAKFDYAVFPDGKQDSYRSLTLRNGGNDWVGTMFRDALISELASDLSDLDGFVKVPALHTLDFRPAIMYLNGSYYGVYNLRERADKNYVRTHFGWSDDEIDFISHQEEVREGSIDAWAAFHSFLQTADGNNPADFAQITNQIDLEGYTDYLLYHLVVDNQDWPAINDRRVRYRSDTARWHWITFDADLSMGLLTSQGWDTSNATDNSLERLLNPTMFEHPNPEWATRLFMTLNENTQWRTYFCNRLADYLSSIFAPTRVHQRIDEMLALFDPEEEQHNNRWFNLMNRDASADRIKAFASNRPAILYQHFAEAYPEIDTTAQLTLQAQPSNAGTIEVSTLTIDEEDDNGGWTGTRFTRIDIPLRAIPKPGFAFEGWTGDIEGTENNLLLNMGGNMNITAVFTEIPPVEDSEICSATSVHATPPTEGFYNEDEVIQVEMFFDQADYWQQLLDNYESKTEIPATVTINGETYDSTGVRFKGSTSFLGNPFDKKSFGLSLDQWIDGQDVAGYNTLNLNSAYEDPSAMRELLYNWYGRAYGLSLKSNVAQLSINGENWGSYINVQQLNSDYLREWFTDADGTRWRSGVGFSGGPGGASLNYLGADTTGYFNNYTLKKTHKTNPWSDLIQTAQLLESLPPNERLYDTLNQVLNIDRALWFLAHETIFADEDSYIIKGGRDYYVHWDSLTQQITPLEYDGNSTMYLANVEWSPFPNEDDPRFALCYRLFRTPELRQRYLAHLRTILCQYLRPDIWETRIQHYATLLDPLVSNDPQAIYSYEEFVNDQDSVRLFLEQRRAFLLNHSEINRSSPTINEHQQPTGNEIVAGQTVPASVAIQSTTGVAQVRLYYQTATTKTFVRLEMNDTGTMGDATANDGIYTVLLPAQRPLTVVNYYVEAIAADDFATATYFPANAEQYPFQYQTEQAISTNNTLVINELLARNDSTLTDEAGEFDDWIEIYNTGNEAIDLTNYYLSDDRERPDKWQFPTGIVIAPDDYVLVWADEDQEQGSLHTNFKLNGDGESILLSDPDLVLIDAVDFPAVGTDTTYARLPNGTGDFFPAPPTPLTINTDFPDPVSAVESLVPLSAKVYPNPANNLLVIESSTDLGEGILFNVHGQLVARYNINKGLQRYDVSGLVAGIYTLKVDGFRPQKIIVLR